MADVTIPTSGACLRRQPSRLQRRAPASLQISPVSDWNVAIPLLSPLASPSSSPKALDRTAENKSREDQRRLVAEPDKPIVFKKWQHPAAPFCYEPAPLVRPFVPV
ncbi:hypothetical protein PanWU01x14_362290 [Parasponia andersonii]|uniref:Uncharacterized protein n=1 Tax=Parasponia andersonii TaxID=3476 RepID=A0A2P5A713_PARAD|nr:hypothetical protein PanWU01x14_362290 [Parasponia andersonii]